mgnify:CR=1 FL=1
MKNMSIIKEFIPRCSLLDPYSGIAITITKTVYCDSETLILSRNPLSRLGKQRSVCTDIFVYMALEILFRQTLGLFTRFFG